MDQLICASLSHTHYWYEVGTLKVPAAIYAVDERVSPEREEERGNSQGRTKSKYMTSFAGVTFVLFCFVFVLMLSLKSRPFAQSSFDMQAPR